MHTSFQRLFASFLFFHFVLQSCSQQPTFPCLPPVKASATSLVMQDCSKTLAKQGGDKLSLRESKAFCRASREVVSFTKEGDSWKAHIQDPFIGVGMGKSIPVISSYQEELGYILQNLPQEALKHRMHMLHTPSGKCIFIGCLGLKGGMEIEEIQIEQVYRKLLREGMSYIALGKCIEALDCYDKALALKPNSAVAHIRKGDVLSELGNQAEAIVHYDKALLLDPNDAVAYFNKGIALAMLGQLKEQIDCYDKALALNPNLVDAYIYKGYALCDLGNQAKAIACYDQALALEPSHAAVYFDKGNALLELNEKAEAMICYDKVLALDPNHTEAYFQKGKIFAYLNLPLEELACYNKALELNPNLAHVYVSKGLVLAELESDPAEEINCYDKALILDPSYAIAYFNKGVALEELGQQVEALACYDEAIKLNPNDVEAYFNKGVALDDLGHKEEVIRYYDQAIALNPKYAKAYFKKGVSLDALSHKEEGSGYQNLAKGIEAYNLQQYSESIVSFNQALETFEQITHSQAAEDAMMATTSITAYYFKLLACIQLHDKHATQACLVACKKLGFLDELFRRLVKNEAVDATLLSLGYDNDGLFIEDLRLIQDEHTFNVLLKLYSEKIVNNNKDIKHFNVLLEDLRNERSLQQLNNEQSNASNQEEEVTIPSEKLIAQLTAISQIDVSKTPQLIIDQLRRAKPKYKPKFLEYEF